MDFYTYPIYAAVCSHGLLHIPHATLLYVLIDFYTYPIYAAVCSHGLLHIPHATLLYVLIDFYTYPIYSCCVFSWTSTHTSCYAAVRSHRLLYTYPIYAAVCSHGLLHIPHATLLYVLIDFYTYPIYSCCVFSWTSTHTSCYAAVRSHRLLHISNLRCCVFSWTSTHTSCYAAVRSHRLLHISNLQLLCVLMDFYTYLMLRCCTFS